MKKSKLKILAVAMVTVAVISCTKDPNPDFSFDKNNVYPLVNITFTNVSTNASSYLWDFGDGTTTTTTNPVHQFTLSGTKNVILTANNGSKSKSVTKSINILAPPIPVSGMWSTTNSGNSWVAFDVSSDGKSLIPNLANQIFGFSNDCIIIKFGDLTQNCDNYAWYAVATGHNVSVTNASFSYTSTNGWSITGSFSSSTSCSGTANINSPCSDGGYNKETFSWTASPYSSKKGATFMNEKALNFQTKGLILRD